jgi:RNA polymerase sigma-70 factor (ECF subfamily)
LSLPQPDYGVLRKAQRGDERAFTIIVRAYQVPVFNYVLRLVGDRALAEDLTQEIFLRVFQGLPRFSLRSKFTTWLFQVSKNRVLDELRAVERRPRAVVDIADVPHLEVLDAPFERLEAIDAVWRAVENLNVDLKMALLLRDVVGLSYTEIADSLEVTLATVKWRIYKAREDVQLALAREGIHLYGDEQAGRPRPPPSPPPSSSAALHCPSCSRRPSISGSPASRISACVWAMSYSTRWNLARRASRSRTRYAARGSPSRG